MGRVEGKVAIVTGGASGIGKATCILLANEGAKVVITDINEPGGKQTREEIEHSGGICNFIRHDVTRETDWKNVIDQTLQNFGKLDIMVNNAGVPQYKDVENTTLEEWKRVMSVNLDGVFLGTKCAIEAMKRNGSGSIINIASVTSKVGIGEVAAYTASKGGVGTFTKSVALHCAKSGYNIRVNSIHPGYIWTPILNGANEGTKKHWESLHPIGHLGDPTDIAYGVLYLASDESKFMIGSELVIDGGYTAQ